MDYVFVTDIAQRFESQFVGDFGGRRQLAVARLVITLDSVWHYVVLCCLGSILFQGHSDRFPFSLPGPV